MSLHLEQELVPPISAAYDALAAAPAQLFADLVYLASAACGTPQAALALAGPVGFVFKAQRGFAPATLHALDGFCQAVMHAETVLINDQDLFPDSAQPLFCAGVALRGPDGQALGVLCVSDPAARTTPTDAQREALACLARRAADHLALTLAHQTLEAQQQQLAAAFRLAPAAEPGLRPELFVKQDTRLVRVAPADVTHFEALGDYVNLYTVRERLTVYGTMKDMQARLPAADFARVHRKYIIRLDRLVGLDGDVVLLDAGRDGSTTRPATSVPIGSSYKAALLARLQIL
ncbi:LytR/AlgR family response regulator transcription factor [Hymenobacter caeli]|uniref:DNA-binding LytR/AlgR family response regulator n=1 Tax=Hymenobacter caeli TaxID=2735894 RepID=A0ABX2FN65_9BACT|nr:LytTR family DNA-binding domain-containing protein [Hymenobacter caeli]NRT17976.1 DNA-binding LytR/AlgR family response regulator [Hymenobacter caeli]